MQLSEAISVLLSRDIQGEKMNLISRLCGSDFSSILFENVKDIYDAVDLMNNNMVDPNNGPLLEVVDFQHYTANTAGVDIERACELF